MCNCEQLKQENKRLKALLKERELQLEQTHRMLIVVMESELKKREKNLNKTA